MIVQFGRIALVGLLIVFLVSCKGEGNESEPGESLKDVVVDEVSLSTSIWLVDWQVEESLYDVAQIVDSIDNLSLFATYFDENGEFYQPEQTEQLINKTIKDLSSPKSVYMTFVNDQFMADGTIIQKNPVLLNDILASSSSRNNHIEQLLTYAKNFQIDGIEIDYEKIPKDLTDEFLRFIDELYVALDERGLSLRVILEPSFPLKIDALAQDIQFVVMAYNVFGFHSGPGPKANYQFLDKVVSAFPNQVGNVGIALATGGFRWHGDNVQSLTEKDIQTLIDRHQVKPKRDNESDALTFTYSEDNNQVEVWYADNVTLTSWVRYLALKGDYRNFSFWRSGGLTQETLTSIANLNIEVNALRREIEINE